MNSIRAGSIPAFGTKLDLLQFSCFFYLFYATLPPTMTHTNLSFTDVSPAAWLSFLHTLADGAQDVALHYFESTLQVITKSDNSPVTQGDLEIETLVRKEVALSYPGLSILGEEHGQCPLDAPFKLIIDPIDATSNFMRHIPFFATLLAIEINGIVVAAVVAQHATGDRWSAALGEGAFHNGKPISVSTVSEIADCQAFYGGLFGREARGNFESLMRLLSQTRRQRGLGDYLAHMLVAEGCGEFAIDFGLAPWDIAPLGLIVVEAGGRVTQVDGSPFSPYTGSILTSNGQFHEALVRTYASA